MPAPGISEDLALLLAYEKGAELIVAVGTHFNLIEFLEREPRRDVVDVRHAAEGGGDPRRREGVSRLVSGRVGVWPLFVFALAGFGATRRGRAVSPSSGT